MVKPYKEIDFGNNKVRHFENFDPKDLYWHKDEFDREIFLVEGEVQIQLDNELPVKLRKFKRFYIPKETYHRVIATGSFTILIKEKPYV